jgi:hypothetical protein
MTGREIQMPHRNTSRYRCQILDTAQIVAIALIGAAMAPTLGGALSLSASLQLQPADYLMTQRADHSAVLVGVLGLLALAGAGVHSFLVRGNAAAFAWSIVAVAGLAAAQIVFWAVAFPALAHTQNWTVAPENFEGIRQQWEYAQAAAGVLSFGSLLAVARAIEASRPIASLAILESIERDAAVRLARSRAQPVDGSKQALTHQRNVAA